MKRRFHSSIAFSADGAQWYLINATPDIRFQLESFKELQAGPDLRSTPLQGVLLTDAELDHTIGLLIVREGSPLTVWSSKPILETLAVDFPLSKILTSYNSSRWQPIEPLHPVSIAKNVQVTAYPLGAKQPLYTHNKVDNPACVLGYKVADERTGKSFFYAPQIAAWTPELQSAIEASAICFVDGTFWSSTELIDLGVSNKTSLEMGHLPLSGQGGIAMTLKDLVNTTKVLVHINNTNPILDESSAEFRLLRDYGIEPGYDGMEFEIREAGVYRERQRVER
jgi:pyrroloquinoline quinone biosynthesis protein B